MRIRVHEYFKVNAVPAQAFGLALPSVLLTLLVVVLLSQSPLHDATLCTLIAVPLAILVSRATNLSGYIKVYAVVFFLWGAATLSSLLSGSTVWMLPVLMLFLLLFPAFARPQEKRNARAKEKKQLKK